MPDCGCSNNSDSCYPNSNVVAQVVYPVTYNDSCGSSGAGSTCPTNYETSTPTSSAGFTIPAVGATFNLALICNASKFNIGQWVQLGSLGGRYPIVGINASTNVLTLRNSCPDGASAIAGNPDPGTSFGGTIPVWLTGSDPCLDAAAFCQDVKECLQSISDDNPLCLPNLPVTTPAQCVYMLGLSAACDAGDCPQQDDPNCLTKLDAVRFCEDTIIFQDGLEEAIEDACVRPVVINEDGHIQQAPPGSGIVQPTKAYLGVYQAPFTNGAGLVAALNFSINLADYGVPGCAVGATVRLVYRYDFDTGAGDGPWFTTFLRATGQPSQNIAYAVNFVNAVAGSSVQDRPTSDALGGISVTFGPDRVIYHELQNNGTIGNGNFVSVQLWLDAIIL